MSTPSDSPRNESGPPTVCPHCGAPARSSLGSAGGIEIGFACRSSWQGSIENGQGVLRSACRSGGAKRTVEQILAEAELLADRFERFEPPPPRDS